VNFIALLLAFLVAAQSIALPQFALAAAVNYNQGGGVQGQVPVHKVGNLLFAEGLALLNGSDISVTAKSQTTNQLDSVLKGKLIKTQVTSAGGNTFIKGISYFNGGSQLPSLEPNCKGESVELNDGSKVAGPIEDISQDAVSIAGKTIPMGSVSAIHSGHVFNFHMKVSGPGTNGAVKGDSNGIDFAPTCQQQTTSVKTSHTKFKLIVFGLVVAGIATGVACGVAIPLSVHHHHSSSTPIFAPTTPTITQQTVKTMVVTRAPIGPLPNTAYQTAVNKLLGTKFRFTASTTGTGHTIVTIPPAPTPNSPTSVIFLVRGQNP
jgi:hypothetical protein